MGGYAVSIWPLALVVRHVPVSTAHVLWAGMGTPAVAVIGALWLGESLTPLKVAALGMMIAGVVVLNCRAH